MKRPEKIKHYYHIYEKGSPAELDNYHSRGYNSALDDMDAWLPSEEEIGDIIGNIEYPRDEPLMPNSVYIFFIANAIHRRIRE